MKKHKVTKAIRFKLEPDDAPFIEEKAELLQEEPSDNLSELVSKGFELEKLLKEYIYFNEEKNKLKKSVNIPIRWLKIHTKDAYYEWKGGDSSGDKRPKLTDVPYLPDKFDTLLKEWKSTLEELNNAAHAPQESKTRKANIAHAIKKLGVRSLFPFIEDFVKESQEKDTDEIRLKLIALTEKFKTLMWNCEQWALPAQSSGIEIARASFNYYTVSKKPKDFDKERNKLKEKLGNLPKDIRPSAIPAYKQLINFDKDNKSYYIKLIKEDQEQWVPMDIEALYQGMKQYKSKQKKDFTEAMSKGLSYDTIKNRFPLFDNHEAFEKYAELTKKITEFSSKKNNLDNKSEETKKLNKKISSLKNKRGKLFYDGKSRGDEPTERFIEYVKFCRTYKKVAQKRGQLIARLKSIDKEETDSQRLQYWSVLIQKDNEHKLTLIPKFHSKEAYHSLRTLQNSSSDTINIIYYFESLTYQALKKLCFGVNGNTFLPEIKKELKQKGQWSYDDRDFGEHVFKKGDGERDEQGLIIFYKNVLQTRFVQNNLMLPDTIEKNVIEKDFDKEQDFRIALEKCCYVRHKKIPGNWVDDWLQKYNAELLKITSYDLEKKDKKKLKPHTKTWLDFWKEENEQERFPLRLNPEITIRWREPKPSRIEKYGKGSELHDPEKKNRYLHPQFTLVTTFTENALNPEINYAFKDSQQKGKAILDFNGRVNNELNDHEDLWYYGIDTGKVELATLCLMNKDEELQPFSILKLKENLLDYEKTGYLKDGTRKKYKALQNLSYFLNPELYQKTFKDDKFKETFKKLFERKEVPAIDLSKAKVINGYIVLNGAVPDYNNLRNLAEKRLEQRRKEGVTAEKINNFRKAITSNIIGVIHHLYKKYPGVVMLEDHSQNWIEDERLKDEGRVEKPLEWAVYRKFQSLGLTPPISELVRLREVEKFEFKKEGQKKYNPIKQFGILSLVNKEGSSLYCPNCGNKAYSSEDEFYSDKQEKVFQCGNCNYHNHENTNGFVGLDNNDKIAAFNIAKWGMKQFVKEGANR